MGLYNPVSDFRVCVCVCAVSWYRFKRNNAHSALSERSREVWSGATAGYWQWVASYWGSSSKSVGALHHSSGAAGFSCGNDLWSLGTIVKVKLWFGASGTNTSPHEALLTLSLSILIRTLVSQASRHGFDSDNYFSEVGWIWLSLCLSLSVSLAPLLQEIGSSEASRDATSLAANKLTDLRRNCECSPHRMQCPATFWSSFECSPELHPFQREKQMFLSWLFMFVSLFQYVLYEYVNWMPESKDLFTFWLSSCHWHIPTSWSSEAQLIASELSKILTFRVHSPLAPLVICPRSELRSCTEEPESQVWFDQVMRLGCLRSYFEHCCE